VQYSNRTIYIYTYIRIYIHLYSNIYIHLYSNIYTLIFEYCTIYIYTYIRSKSNSELTLQVFHQVYKEFSINFYQLSKLIFHPLIQSISEQTFQNFYQLSKWSSELTPSKWSSELILKIVNILKTQVFHHFIQAYCDVIHLIIQIK